jgi:thiol-disulfide isomerase/thioredoxin
MLQSFRDQTPANRVAPADGRHGNSTLTALGLIVIAAVVLYVIVARNRAATDPDVALSHPAVGAPLEDFDIDVLTGEGEDVLAGDLKGKVTLINFWGPWCGYCLEEFPHLAKLAENLKSRDDFVWLPVTYGNPIDDPPQQLRQEASAFLARSGLKTVTYYDPRQSLIVAASAAGAFERSFPCTILLDRSGQIHAVWNGYSAGTETQIEAAVMGLLE